MADIPGTSSRGLTLLSVAPTITLLASICVTLRFLSRWLASSIRIDDWVCLVSLVFAYGAMVGSVVIVTIGHDGYRALELMPSVPTIHIKLVMTCLVTYHVSIALTKTSILLFYQRLFALHKYLLRAIWVLHVLVLGFLITSVCVTIIAYIPIEVKWKPWVPHRGIVKNANAMSYSLGAINSGLDFAVLILPQRAVWTMRMDRRQKLLVSGAFMLGAIVCGMTVARLAIVDFSDLTHISIYPWTLYLIEMDISIICACLPMFPSLFRRWRSKFTTHSIHSTSSSRTLHVSFRRPHRRQSRDEPAVEDSDELNTQVDPAYQGASYYLVEMKPARVHTRAIGNWDSTTGSRDRSRGPFDAP